MADTRTNKTMRAGEMIEGLGQDGLSYLRTKRGMSDEEIARLGAAGVVTAAALDAAGAPGSPRKRAEERSAKQAKPRGLAITCEACGWEGRRRRGAKRLRHTPCPDCGGRLRPAHYLVERELAAKEGALLNRAGVPLEDC